MSKFLYPIYKLKTKSYIKWWLYHKKAGGSGILSEILEGFSFNLENTLNRKFKLFEIEGNSVQDGTPSPDNEVPIKSAGDNGSINEKVQNKNLVYFANPLTVTGSINIPCDLPVGTYTISCSKTQTIGTTNYMVQVQYEDNTNAYFSMYREALTGTLTLTKKANNIRLYSQDEYSHSQGVTTTFYNLMLEQGSTATDYVPHEEQILSFPLAQGQKLMQGDYLADDGIHHVRGEIVFNENNINKITNRGVYNDIPKAHINKTLLGMNVDYKGNVCLMNKYQEITNTSQAASGKFSTTFDNGNIWVFDDRFTDLETARSLLIGTAIQFKLATEVIDPYTEEQKEAWKQIKKARTYKSGTHISSEDETPAHLKIQYYKEG